MKKNQKIGIKMFGKRINWEKDRKLLTEEEEEGFGWRDSLRVGSHRLCFMAGHVSTIVPSGGERKKEREIPFFKVLRGCYASPPRSWLNVCSCLLAFSVW